LFEVVFLKNQAPPFLLEDYPVALYKKATSSKQFAMSL